MDLSLKNGRTKMNNLVHYEIFLCHFNCLIPVEFVR